MIVKLNNLEMNQKYKDRLALEDYSVTLICSPLDTLMIIVGMGIERSEE